MGMDRSIDMGYSLSRTYEGDGSCKAAMDYSYDSCLLEKTEETINREFNCSVPFIEEKEGYSYIMQFT